MQTCKTMWGPWKHHISTVIMVGGDGGVMAILSESGWLKVILSSFLPGLLRAHVLLTGLHKAPKFLSGRDLSLMYKLSLGHQKI